MKRMIAVLLQLLMKIQIKSTLDILVRAIMFFRNFLLCVRQGSRAASSWLHHENATHRGGH